jgi:hypothetical protein
MFAGGPDLGTDFGALDQRPRPLQQERQEAGVLVGEAELRPLAQELARGRIEREVIERVPPCRVFRHALNLNDELRRLF